MVSEYTWDGTASHFVRFMNDTDMHRGASVNMANAMSAVDFAHLLQGTLALVPTIEADKIDKLERRLFDRQLAQAP
jgi:hypothetical protein